MARGSYDGVYVFAAIELEEGSLMHARLADPPVAAADLAGAPVEAVFVPFDEGRKLPHVRMSV